MRGMWVLLSVVVAVGCGGGSDKPPTMDASVERDACVATTPRTVYLHRGGGTYHGGPVPDSSTNTTTLLGATTTLPAPTIVEQDWQDYVTCVESKFASLNVAITTTDPGTASHLELVVIDRADQIGAPTTAGLLAPANQCQGGKGLVLERGIAFAMWETLATAGNRCQKSAQAIGFLFGLDRAFACMDIMAWDTTICVPPGDAAFLDAETPCGETEARTCQCGFPTENTFRQLELVTSQCPV